MKKISTIFAGLGCFALLMSSCNGILEEDPKTIYAPNFFTTPAGIEGGLTALYTHMRYLYGNAYLYNSLTTGTDEATWGQSADGNFKNADLSGAGELTASSAGNGTNFWSFTYINTANGIIANGESVGLSPALLAEARLFRAFDYFNLVRCHGGVPLDLGSGELAFNTSAIRTSIRNTVPEVYEKCIFPDLEYAVENLPEKPRVTGALTKTAARILLSKAYLTYAWWLENPENIPTYPECTRDKSKAPQYFQKAYDVAVEGIENPGPFGLESSYYRVNLGSNDRNKEQVPYADHTENSEQYNGASLTYGSGGGQDNFASWMMQWNYPNMNAVNNEGKTISPVLRTDDQFLGRPWTRMAPTQEALAKFDDLEHDSRFDGTFTWIYRTNWSQGGNNSEWVEGPNGDHIGLNEPFLKFINAEDPDVTYPGNLAKVGLGMKPGEKSFVIDRKGVSRLLYPSLWKIGPYRTNSGSPETIGEPNASSTRPFVILKFSELYFLAAEANVKGATAKSGKSAYDLINVIRARAGKWEIKNNEQIEYSADFSAEMVAATPKTITVDYLLDERLREYYGEGFRWFELARTQTWHTRAASFTICGAGVNDHTPQTFSRTIEKTHYLRPIPQSQIDAMMMSNEEKAAYQNPGY